MKSIDPIERLLGQTPVPSVVEGPHREQLKQRLLESAQTAQPRREPMRISLLSRMSPMMKVAAGLMLAAMLIGTGWAADKIYMKWNGISFTLESHPGQSVTLPNGATLNLGGHTLGHEESGDVSSDVQEAVETAKRHHEEDNRLIAEKKYEFVKTFEYLSETNYVYNFTYADGSRTKTSVQLPLEDVTSWDDYDEKQKEQAEKIEKAVLAGNFRLIDVNTIDCWICRNVDSNERLNVRHARLPGYDYAHATLEAAEEPKQIQEMTWQEHLKAIRDGKREILGTKNETVYTYEAALEDGSKATFTQDHPLKKLEEDGK
jgi:hypothetical protein